MSKILIIDDEESIRVLLKLSLTRKGYEVITAEDGEKGIEVFERESPPPGPHGYKDARHGWHRSLEKNQGNRP